MPNKRADYRVTKKTPIGHGGCAIVYRAHHKLSNNIVAFKESYADPYARRRMAREISVQASLSHANVMPILDSDSTQKWFTMPLADGDLRNLQAAMSLRDQVQMIDEVAQGLGAAHQLGHVHRDVTPGNILRLSENGMSRFVVADWGLVRQPHGHTTAVLTSENRFIGTQGFAAPEMYVDPHAARAPADVYSLGRVAAWMATGTLPLMMEPLLPEGPWRSFVRRTTERDASVRVQTMGELRELLAEVREEAPIPSLGAPELAKRALAGDSAASLALAQLGLDDRDNAELFLDYVRCADAGSVVTKSSEDASALVSSMLHHVTHEWGRRSFNDANPVLRWILQVAQAAEGRNVQGLLEDSARALFEGEAHWERYDQRRLTREWLVRLRGTSAQTVARALRAAPSASSWYLQEGWTPTSADSAIRGALAAHRVPRVDTLADPIVEYGSMSHAERLAKIRAVASVHCGDEDDITKLSYAAFFLDRVSQTESDPEVLAQIALMRAHIDRENAALADEMEQNNPRY